MARRLKRLKIFSVGIVDSPANEREYLVYKRLEDLSKGGETKVERVPRKDEELIQESEGKPQEKKTKVTVDPNAKVKVEVSADEKKATELEEKLEIPEGLTEEEKSAYTDFMSRCLKTGKSMKECALEWQKQQKKAEKAEETEKVEETEKADPYPEPGEKYPNIPAGSFKKIFSMIDKLIQAEENEDKKKALQTLKAALSKIVGGSYPYPEAKETKKDEKKPDLVAEMREQLAQLEKEMTEHKFSAEIENLRKEIREIAASVKKVAEVVSKNVPLRKAVVKEEEEPRKDEITELIKSKEFKEATPGEQLRLLMRGLEKKLK